MILELNARAFRAAQLCAAKKDLRWYLNGVYLSPCGLLYGSNSHVAARGPSCADLSEVPHRLVTLSGPIPASAATILLDTDRRTWEAGGKSGTYITEASDGEPLRYPDMARVWPKSFTPCDFAIAPKYAALVGKVFEFTVGVTVRASGIGGAVSFSACDIDMIVMPVRV